MMYSLYRLLLRLCDTKTGCMDKVKYFVMQTDRLLESGLDNVLEKLKEMDNKFDVAVTTYLRNFSKTFFQYFLLKA
jgi:hypothetical protein